ncbi:MAG: hypothetical protein AB9900_12555 [Humidesulfovibrio sp.]
MTPTPITAPHELRPALRLMLQDLECERLEVILVPAPERRVHRWQAVRAVFSRNPDWYRELAATFQRTRRVRTARKSDPRFKRADVVDVLQRLLSGGTRSYLAWPLLAVAKGQRSAFDFGHPWTASVAHQAENFPYDMPADLYAEAGAMEATL